MKPGARPRTAAGATMDGMTASVIERLRRWEESGASWELIDYEEGIAVIVLRTRQGEPVDTIESDDPELVDFVEASGGAGGTQRP
jgi:hypothetical protein